MRKKKLILKVRLLLRPSNYRACDLASGNDPSEIANCQSGMRQHLIRCLENEHFEPFPVRTVCKKTPRKSQRVVTLTCFVHVACQNATIT